MPHSTDILLLNIARIKKIKRKLKTTQVGLSNSVINSLRCKLLLSMHLQKEMSMHTKMKTLLKRLKLQMLDLDSYVILEKNFSY